MKQTIVMALLSYVIPISFKTEITSSKLLTLNKLISQSLFKVYFLL